jgi:protein AroM
MSVPKLGTVTIGQAPRADVLPELDPHLPDGIERLHTGVLDRLSDADIASQFAPRPREQRMLARLLDGRPIEVDARAAEAAVQRKVLELEDAGCTVVAVLSTAVFRALRARRAWLIEPHRILPALVGGLVGPRRVGILAAIEMPLDAARRKWAALQIPPSLGVASPYAATDDGVVAAARELQRNGATALLLDSIGYTSRHRAAVTRATGLPVLASSDLVARVTGACLYDAS